LFHIKQNKTKRINLRPVTHLCCAYSCSLLVEIYNKLQFTGSFLEKLTVTELIRNFPAVTEPEY